MKETEFALRGDYIELNVLLKLLSIAHSGGAAKMLVAEGLVSVDGEVELRKTRKLRAGNVVGIGGERIRIVGAAG